ncbi:hypothetical protein [Roseimaritima ulvae]|uniref:Uncharacterized protein n=1 Tax=Roseimaritima ulvae TaxID=980254 RepID=A0A5B9QXH4_9BACT|nr:hypothetical protein [Roseimaritima ulvae]QEG42065.1 hypothetical protein UC8_40950 [Roseimaritima ulvae]
MRQNLLRDYGIVGLALILCLCSLAGSARFASASEVTITVDDTDASAAAGLTVTALRWDQGKQRFEIADVSWHVDTAGALKADLSPGGYQFELKGKRGNEMVFCRSPKMAVEDHSESWFVELHPIQIKFVHADQSLGLRHLAIRSLAPKGESIIHDGESIPAANFLTTAETRLDATLIGEDSDTVALGHALIVPTRSQFNRVGSDAVLVATVKASGRHWYERPVLLSQDNPPIAAATLTLVHPRGELVVQYREGVSVVTNRPLFRLGYRLESVSGKVLVSRKCFVLVGKIKRFVLGGELQASAFARVLKRLPSSHEYRVAGILSDPSGIEIDLKASQIDWSENFTFRNGLPLPRNPLDKVSLGLLADPVDTVRTRVAWNWASNREAVLRPMSFVPFRSEHFTLDAPPAWRDRSEIYLSQLEHCYGVLRRNTGRKGPRKTDLRWRLNTHNAKAKVGGKTSWMSMPLKGLYEAGDPFGHPWFMVHEMLHTFGYNHGSSMTKQVNMGRRELALTRWQIPWQLYNARDVEISVGPPILTANSY